MGGSLFFCCCCLLLSGLSLLRVQAQPPAPTNNTLRQGELLKDGETIISHKHVFELGFFTPAGAADPAVRYVGIWYYNVTPRAVVWVANRNTPLRSRNGRFGISASNNTLELFDAGNSTVAVWSSGSSASPLNAFAVLTDQGNLELRSARGNATLWQSFDHPGDTFIPGMMVTLDRNSGENTVVTSWRNPADPAEGRYSIGLDPAAESAQLYMWEEAAGGRKTVRWRSGPWDGQVFVGTRMPPRFIYGFRLVAEEQGRLSLTFNSEFNTSVRYRFVLQPDGVENTTTLQESTHQWYQVWAQPVTDCEFYNHCGANAECDDSSGSSTCRCLQGYRPKSDDEWGEGNWSRGCVRRTPLQCEGGSDNSRGDGFYTVEGVKPPDFGESLPSAGTEAACRDLCWGNCTCRAYAYISNGCRVWSRDLIDLHRYLDNKGIIHLKLAASDLPAQGIKKKTWIIALSASLAGAATLVLVSFYLWWRYRTRIVQGRADANMGSSSPQIQFSSIDFTSHDPSNVGEDASSSELPVFQFDSMTAATNNFHPTNMLGRGGFGEVFKGVLPSGEEVAVKRLSKTSGQGLEEFKTEAILIAKLQHRNLVRLLGCCVEKEEKMLIYEYLPNKSLDAFLFDPVKKEILDWKRRFDIIQGVAWGLLYLHRDSRLRVVHRDLKASNILLDEDMKPKISDFGMARIFGANQNQENTTRVVGTFGYMSPEYAMEGLFSAKSDIYSFGVLILEIISGKKNSTFHRAEGNTTNLIGHVWKLWRENRAMELADPCLATSLSPEEVFRCIHVGLLCVQDRAVDRPIMSSVVLMLGSESAILPAPRQPTFTLDGSPGETVSFTNEHDYFTSSDVTYTDVSVR